jgi:hypothetical protein
MTYPGFTSMTARDLENGNAVRLPGRERYVGQIAMILKQATTVDILWTDGTETRDLHGNTFVQVQIWAEPSLRIGEV